MGGQNSTDQKGAAENLPPKRPSYPRHAVPQPERRSSGTLGAGNLLEGGTNNRPKWFPLLVEDTTDADNQIALAGYAQEVMNKLEDLASPQGIIGISPRHADLSFPSAFNKHIVKNRPDFRAFEPAKNAHEGTETTALADRLSGLNSAEVEIDIDLVARNEVRRTYSEIMKTLGFDPTKKESWDLFMRALPSTMLPLPQEHLLSHHYFAREFLFDRGDLEGHTFGTPLPPKAYTRVVGEIDGEVAANKDGAYDREQDVASGLAEARRKRARAHIEFALEQWDKVLQRSHLAWLDDARLISENAMGLVTDVVIMAPCTLTMGHWMNMKCLKRVWGMFFALDNAAEYGHWVMEQKAKNIFRNNFNTALDEDGTLRMLHVIRQREMRAYFHPTELFKSDLGKQSWGSAREAVEKVKESMIAGNVDVPPLLGVYNCYNAAKSPNCDPQQISDPMIVYEYVNFIVNLKKTTPLIAASADEGSMMPVASYSPAMVAEDVEATRQNYEIALAEAGKKGVEATKIERLVRRERVFVAKPAFEPLNCGVYVGMNFVQRMVPSYSKWLETLMTSKPELLSPREHSEVIPILDKPIKDLHRFGHCGAGPLCCGA